MTRGTIDGLHSAVPIVSLLPGIYQDDLFTQEFTGGLDDVLAPVFTTLDCLDTYVDPWLAPEDFLEWLAGWVGVVIDEGWPLDRSRAFIASIRRNGAISFATSTCARIPSAWTPASVRPAACIVTVSPVMSCTASSTDC